ncbi:hypothetical protein ACTI_48050 [Actinoplanes sp. OR16]|nr:hypothetical protein ACTI_48050 [Actinoplanes sp. OR16]
MLAGFVGLTARIDPPDLVEFAGYGQRLLGGHLDGIYDSGWTQAGPLQLLISRLLLIGGTEAPAAATIFGVDALLMVAGLRLCRGDPRREIATALLTLLWLTLPFPWDGHPAELLIPAAWAGAAVLSRDHRPIAAAVTLGLSAAIAPWAVLGFPCLLATTRLPRAVLVAAAGGVLGVAAYLPFVLAGDFGMFRHVWQVADGTLADLAGLDTVTWPLRLVQAVIVAGGCAWVAWRCRDQLFAAPAAATLLRIATDPVVLRYYWGPVALTTVLTLALIPDRRWWAAVLLGYAALLSASLGLAVAGALACLGILLATIHLPARP